MAVKDWLVRKIRSAVGTRDIVEAIRTHVTSEVERLAPGSPERGMQVLPGTPYQQFLLPLEYMPSRRYEPRWGYEQPPHRGLEALFARNTAAYVQRITEMRALAPALARIKRDFTPESGVEAGWIGGPITTLDLAILYYFVYKYRPRTYLEIGSGCTTCFARRAIQDHALPSRIVSVDPQPRAGIDHICDEVIREGLETIGDLGIFERLEAGDIVFVDGSHRVFMNSDVTVFMLDVLPRLAPGVIVHFHDICLPYDYPASFKTWYWSEQYIVATHLLAAHDRIDVLMPSFFAAITPGVKEHLSPPFVSLGDDGDEGWLHGGSLWFTHTARVTPAR